MGVAEAVLNFFTNFAKTGDPNEPREHKNDYGTVKEKTRYRDLVWETYETGSQQYLSIGKNIILNNNGAKVKNVSDLIKSWSPSASSE